MNYRNNMHERLRRPAIKQSPVDREDKEQIIRMKNTAIEILYEINSLTAYKESLEGEVRQVQEQLKAKAVYGVLQSMRHPGSLTDGLIDLISHLPDNIKVLEIGSYSGESTKIFMDSGKVLEMTCIDPWEKSDKFRLYPTNEGFVAGKIFEERLKNFDNIKTIKDYSYSACDLLADKYFDFVYVDANHSYETVKQDIIKVLSKIKDGGMIGGHDYEWPDFEYGETMGVKKAVNETLGIPDFTFSDSSWLFTTIKK